MPSIDDGLNIDDLEHTSQEEVDLYLTRMWRNRGTLYEVSANSVWLDTRPDFAKLHRWGAAQFGRPHPSNILMLSLLNLHSYIHLGWEVGILNEFRVLQRLGVTKAQLMEVVMAAQLSAGIRGLQCVYNAVGLLLPDWRDHPVQAPFPAEWAPDPAAFRSGLDLSTRELTAGDVQNLNDWYMRTLGEVPRSVTFAAKHHPRFLKAFRAKWEAAFRGALPKQMMPCLMLRHATMNGQLDGLREAALLARAWGVSREWVVRVITGTSFDFTGLEALNVVDEAIGDMLAKWD